MKNNCQSKIFYLPDNFDLFSEGALAVNLSKLAKHAQNVEELSVLHGGNVQFGGWWNPPNNTNASKVRDAVVSLLSHFSPFVLHFQSLCWELHFMVRINNKVAEKIGWKGKWSV